MTPAQELKRSVQSLSDPGMGIVGSVTTGVLGELDARRVQALAHLVLDDEHQLTFAEITYADSRPFPCQLRTRVDGGMGPHHILRDQAALTAALKKFKDVGAVSSWLATHGAPTLTPKAKTTS